MLTNGELKQIKDYLALYGKKDSQLEAVPVNLDYPEVTFEANDYLSVVQDSKNKTIKIKDLEKVFLLTFLTDEDFREALKGKIPEEMLENACVTTEKLADGAVTTIKLGDNAVTTAKIATGAITGDKIVNNTIQGSAFAANSITTDKIVDGTVTGDKLADGSIQSVDIKDNTLSGSKFIDNSISGSKIQDNVIESKHLLDNSIPASKIKDGSIESIDIKDGTLDGVKIKDNTIESAKLANNAITVDKIIDNSITTDKIANNAVTENKIVDDSITTAKIANSSVTTDKIVDEAVTEDKLANGAVTTAKLADGLISEIQNITDATPTIGSVMPVQSGGVKVAIDNVAFSTDEKINTVGIDTEPTPRSDNLVKSGGVERVKVTINPGKNLLNTETSIKGFIISLAGSIGSNPDYDVSDYISVSEGNYYLSTYNDDVLVSSGTGINLYDENKNLVDTVAGTKSLTVPSGIKFIRISYYNPQSQSISQRQVERGTERTSFEYFNPIGGYEIKNLADNSVSTSKLVNNSVTAQKLDNNAVTETKINDGAVIVSKLYTLPKSAIINALDSYGYEISVDNAYAYDNINFKNYVRIPVGTKVTNNGVALILGSDSSLTNRYDIANGVTWTATFEVNVIKVGATAGNVRLSIEGKGFELKDGQVVASKIANNSVTEDKIVNNAVTANKIKDNSITSNKIEDNTIIIDNLSSEIITVKQSKNLLDVSALINGRYINSSGGSSFGTSTYNNTDYIEIKPSTNYHASDVYDQGVCSSSSTYIAFYDENKTYIENSAVPATTISLTSPSNAKYIRLTVDKVTPFYKAMLEEGTSRSTYEEYWVDKKINKNLLYEKVENHSLILESASLAASSSLTANNFPQYIKVNHVMGLSAKITTFDEIYIGLPSYKLHITATNASIENASGGKYYNQAHELTIEDYIGVIVKFRLKGVDCVINTKGGTFKFTYEFTNDSGQTDCSGKPYISLGASTSLTDVKFSSTCDGFTKPIWILGDSMTSVFSVRWTWYPVFEWGYNTFLLQGLAGGTSADLWTDLNKSFALGKPKTLVWMLGANDSDEAYQTKLDEVCNYCDENNIELILVNFPDLYGMSTDSKKSSAIKNAYMLTKNRRYVDFRKAVSSDTTQVIGGYTVNIWYGDDYTQETPPEGSYIGSDRIHPTELGAKAEAVQILSDVPEITNI